MEVRHLTRQQARQIDTIAIEEFGIPGIVLMENAGRNSASIIEQEYQRQGQEGTVLIACGPGNNGGDGFVIARHLTNRNIPVQIALVGNPDQLSPDAKINFGITQRMKVDTRLLGPHLGAYQPEQLLGNSENPPPSIFVDALLGTGAKGAARPPMDGIISTANELPALRIAIDSPTGLDCDTGEVSLVAFHAHLTLTFVGMKTGFQTSAAATVLGRCQIIDIGIPREILQLI